MSKSKVAPLTVHLQIYDRRNCGWRTICSTDCASRGGRLHRVANHNRRLISLKFRAHVDMITTSHIAVKNNQLRHIDQPLVLNGQSTSLEDIGSSTKPASPLYQDVGWQLGHKGRLEIRPRITTAESIVMYLGDSMTKVTIEQPSHCSPQNIALFCKMVEMGEEVASEGLEGRVQIASALIFLHDGAELAAVAALKNPNKNYHRQVFMKSLSLRFADEFPVELGWIFVKSQHRGKNFSKVLVEAAIEAVGNSSMFATSRADNAPMHRALLRGGFVTDGRPYYSNRGDFQLQLFLREGRDSI